MLTAPTPAAPFPERRFQDWEELFGKLFFSEGDSLNSNGKRARETFRVVLQVSEPKDSVSLGRVPAEGTTCIVKNEQNVEGP
mmetsp:Transcript_7901/g.14564  ORF Transcript_7901/g.14564 Transcript_7901/m.14564 type:complete len:82 (-) Transcript_7901:746-991(-)